MYRKDIFLGCAFLVGHSSDSDHRNDRSVNFEVQSRGDDWPSILVTDPSRTRYNMMYFGVEDVTEFFGDSGRCVSSETAVGDSSS